MDSACAGFLLNRNLLCNYSIIIIIIIVAITTYFSFYVHDKSH